ncbi:TAXI family TRAP transporter solute-binding subunit [Sulfitobacter porphyrae]|uniref:TAXI family TRAP transporter solute-binding subunit n=1 Tax=Sulfitobacter porphyrae TaxID=1246864 RepID=A0ABW2BC69_9RHOB
MKTLRNTVAALSLLASIAAAPANAELRSITIGTNPAGSTFFLIGGGFAKMFQEELGIRSTAQPQVGSSVYLPYINNGEMTLGLSSSMDAGLAYTGEGFPASNPNLRTLGRIWILPYAYIAARDSGITRMEDLAGKRVMGNMPTNVALTLVNKAMLESAYLTTDDVVFANSGGLLDGINAVVEGRADAAPVAVTMPDLIEANSAAKGGIVVITNGAKASEGFYEQLVPGTRLGVTKPVPARPFVTEETSIVNYDTLLVTSTSLSDEDAYTLTRTLHENWEQLKKDYPPLRGVALNDLALAESTIPYHPGAVRYYQEIGLWTDQHDANQARVSR